MKNIALIAAVIGASSSAFVHANEFNNSENGATIPVASSNLGRMHGYTIPFNKSVEAASEGQHADVGQFGRMSAYDNAINHAYEVSKGVYANVGQYGRLGGYGTHETVEDNTTIASS
ncbi:MAG: hypothetical protein COC09_09735 [Gammaproteobacteria bacterium]|nr:hypothetical protein [Gammaproteobacteria bacterium]PCH62046.1 MAG: hypothetical protein COC09_09735 [Gammaproteobacteria bacterium]